MTITFNAWIKYNMAFLFPQKKKLPAFFPLLRPTKNVFRNNIADPRSADLFLDILAMYPIN